MRQVSIVVPTYNEKGNIDELIRRINESLKDKEVEYEIIFIDDHSTDGTLHRISQFIHRFPIRFFVKKGEPGKSFSLLEGFAKARYPAIAMIDADLQYPPEAIWEMVKLLESFDIVVSERIERKVSFIRKIASSTFSTLFGKLLHNIDTDVQSGLKVFKKEIIERIKISPTPWTFDLEFLVNARDAGYSIGGYKINFDERKYGESKISLRKAILEIGLSAVKLKFRTQRIIPAKNALSHGFHYKGIKYITYSLIKEGETAFSRTTAKQRKIITLSIFLVILGFILDKHITILSLIFLITIFYLTDILFYFTVAFRSLFGKSEISVDVNKPFINLPTYTIFCPLYKEWQVVGQFTKAIENLNYPKDRLQVLLLLEEDDTETINKIKQMELPKYFERVIVPHSLPKTKPKACNYGLLHAKGEYSVIFDAEDVPEKDQLLKVVGAFDRLSDDTVCVQAKLNFYNPNQNLLTALFTAEYSLWFDMILPGLQSLKAPIPLGGTSNHFRTKDLIRMNGWDAFNVTEDCDLGIRISSYGYKTAIIDSTTHEEANSDVKNWFGQRSRWIKGYMQTYLVHTRSNLEKTLKDSIVFHLVVGGKIFLLFINPLMWVITASYFLLHSSLGTVIHSFFPTPVLYMGIVSLAFGNFLHMYSYMMACAKRKQYHLIKYAFIIPVYWLMMSVAGWIALYQLIRQPHQWFKTLHGLHFGNDNPVITSSLAR